MSVRLACTALLALTAAATHSGCRPRQPISATAAPHRFGFERLADRFDSNQDGRVGSDEYTGPQSYFERLDRDADGVITADDFQWSDPRQLP